jgi:radical SAM family uncharacterized protein/radical SAM-linked protein
MHSDTIDFILSRVEKPSRYLGTEVNAVRKDPGAVRLRFALAFPDLYEIGSSHFGMQILYHVLNSRPEIAAERVFAPARDMERELRASGRALFSLETQTPLSRFDIIGFSLLYELNYTNILTMLDVAGIPFLSAERSRRHPLIIAGGPCTCNPEPVADFFDAMVVGDGEQVVLELSRTWLEWNASGEKERESLLRRWSGIEGVYVPAFFEAGHDADGFQRLAPRLPEYGLVRRAVVADLDPAPFPDRPIVPFGKPVHDRLRLEVSRGCSRGCRFCQAGMIYRPVRERSPQKLLDLAQASLAATGYEDLSLLSLSTGDYGCIAGLMARLMARFAPARVAVSLPSLRAGTLTPELMELIRQVRKTGFTIAPEAGSQRLRDVINKNVTEAEIVETVQDAFRSGWQLIKLYFMIGLPTETEEDLAQLVSLVRRLSRLKGSGRRRAHINVSAATFIPKAHTPFQWQPQLELSESRSRLRRLQEGLALPGVQFKWQQPEMSLLEGMWARGDRRLGRALLAAYRRGCRFDGWGDSFDFSAWMDAFAEAGIDPAFYTTRPRSPNEPLPWDHIDSGVSKEFLAREWENALASHLTPDCRRGECQGCGACDFAALQPRVHRVDPPALKSPAVDDGPPYKKVQISYEKVGSARFFGHLELANILLRALRRAAIPVKFSEGFHPKPKVSFDDPLPTGTESEEEHLVLTVPQRVAPQTIMDGLNAQLPEGLRVHTCSEQISPAEPCCTYRVSFAAPVSLPSIPADSGRLLQASTHRGRLKKIELKDILIKVEVLDPRRLELTLNCQPGKAMRPAELLSQVFEVPESAIRSAVIRKLKPSRKAKNMAPDLSH